MAFLRSEIARDLREIERDCRLNQADTAQTFTWKGVEIPCVPSLERRGLELQIGPSLVEVDLTLIVRLEHFHNIGLDTELEEDEPTADLDLPHPTAKRTLIYQGRTYQIVNVATGPHWAHYEIDLADPDSGK